MNILLINNGTIRLDELKTALKDHTLTTIDFNNLSSSNVNDFDLIILTGSSKYPIHNNEEMYKTEINLIRKTDTPIIGICLGFELICYSFGANLFKLPTKEKGVLSITVTNPEHIFPDIQNFEVYEAHRWGVRDIPSELIELAHSKDGIEAVKHKTKQIYGFQFHPEVFIDKTCGFKIFMNTINLITNPSLKVN